MECFFLFGSGDTYKTCYENTTVTLSQTAYHKTISSVRFPSHPHRKRVQLYLGVLSNLGWASTKGMPKTPRSGNWSDRKLWGIWHGEFHFSKRLRKWSSVSHFLLFICFLNSLTKEFPCGRKILYFYYWGKGQAVERDNGHVQGLRGTGRGYYKGLIFVLFCSLDDRTMKQLDLGGDFIDGTFY